MRRLYLLCLVFIANCSLIAQSPPGACPGNVLSPATFCSDACILCDLDGYVGTNANLPQWEAPPTFCAPQYHSINWVGFVAGTASITLEINTFNCQVGNGLQAAIYRTVDCTTWQSVSNCDPGFNSTILHASALQPGETYFVVIDGNGGDVCDFRIDVVSGLAVAPDVEGTPQIDGPADLCPRGAASYTANNVTGAAAYTWTLNGSVIGYDQSVWLSGLDIGTYQLCVEPSNPCFGPGTSACRDITASPLPLEPVNEEVCVEDLPFNYQGYSFFSAGTYNFSYIRPDGCEQYVLLNLTVRGPNPPTMVNAEICLGEAYSLGNRFFTQAGYYPVVLTDQNGCDSLVELILTVHPPTLTNLGVVAAELPFLVGNIAVDTTGPFKILLADQNGCDSIVAGLLAAIAPDTVFIDSTICQGETVLYNMDTLVSSGIYLDTLISANQDTATIQQLTLTVFPVSETTLNVSLCQGEEITVGGIPYNSTGQYQETLLSANGCDSIITLNLMVAPVAGTTLDVEVCEGSSFFIGGQVLEVAGTYQITFTNPQTGCDSIVTINLAALPNSFTQLDAAICEGETYPFGGVELSQPGAYQEVFVAANGCDSVVALNLAVSPVVDAALDTTLCPGQPLYLGPYIFREPVQEVLQFTGAGGCDSLIALTLSYYDTLRIDTAIIEPDEGDFFGGSISVEMAGGTPPYSYRWSDGRTEPYIDLLPSGRYFLIVTDAASCQESFYLKVPFKESGPGIAPPVARRPGGGGIQVAPNPFSRELLVQLTGVEEDLPVRLLLYNFAGQLVHEESAFGLRHRLQPEAPAGVYWLVAEQEGARIGVAPVVRIQR